MHKIKKLKNGVRLVVNPIPNSHGVTTGIFVKTGSRYETARQSGISHFLEHLFFKGTKLRPTPADLSRAIEGIGGYTNASTSQEYTFFYNRVPQKHQVRGLDVLADMMNNSLFNPDAIEREKGVVIEELNMYLDTPMRYIYDLIMNLTWPNSSLGRDIIGNKKTIRSFDRDDLLNYINENYQSRDIVVVAAGKVNYAKLQHQVEHYFNNWTNKKRHKFSKVTGKQKRARIMVSHKKTDQAHLCIAFPSIGYGHKSEAALAVLNTILGSGMSSRLFLNVREKHGLCYAVHSFIEKFQDVGMVGVSAGLNINRIELAIGAIMEEVIKMTRQKVTMTELREAKEHIRGNISLQMDNSDNMAIWYGIQGLFYNKIQTPEQRIKKLLKVSQNDIIKLAKDLFRKDRLNMAIIGPFTNKDKIRFLKAV